MLVLGVILLVLGIVLGIPVLTWIGVVLLILGAVLWVAPQGFQGGRRWY